MQGENGQCESCVTGESCFCGANVIGDCMPSSDGFVACQSIGGGATNCNPNRDVVWSVGDPTLSQDAPPAGWCANGYSGRLVSLLVRFGAEI